MHSRKIITFISFLVLIFAFHILLYYSLSGYTSFFKKVKYDGIVLNNETEVRDDKKEIFSSYEGKTTVTKSEIQSGSISNTGNTLSGSTVSLQKNNTGTILTNLDKVNSSDIGKNTVNETKLVIGDGEKQILELFKKYNLVEVGNHSSLFDLTTEYPDKYGEYIGKDNSIIVYIFNGKNYNDIYNIFDVISYNLRFKIKGVNNFGESSFYINLSKESQDNYNRLVISYKKVVFGLKIKKDIYNDVKGILKNLK